MMTLLLAIALAAPSDAPRIVQLRSGEYLVSQVAFDAINSEMKRLQRVEREHKDEQWLTTILVSAGAGLLAGVVVGAIVRGAVPVKTASP